MWRLLILVSLAPFIAGGLFANIFGLRHLVGDQKISLSVKVFLDKFLATTGREDITIQYKGKRGAINCPGRTLTLPASYETSYHTAHHARASLDLGMLLLHENHSGPIEFRLKMLKLGHLAPLFMTLIVSFSCLLGKLPPIIGISLFAFSLGLSAVMLWLSMPVEKEAAHLMVSRFEKLRLVPRLSEEESLVCSIRAVPWSRLIPGVLLKLVLKD